MLPSCSVPTSWPRSRSLRAVAAATAPHPSSKGGQAIRAAEAPPKARRGRASSTAEEAGVVGKGSSMGGAGTRFMFDAQAPRDVLQFQLSRGDAHRQRSVRGGDDLRLPGRRLHLSARRARRRSHLALPRISAVGWWLHDVRERHRKWYRMRNAGKVLHHRDPDLRLLRQQPGRSQMDLLLMLLRRAVLFQPTGVALCPAIR